jgi:hypothetical protein
VPPIDLADRSLPIRMFEDPIWYRGHKATRHPIVFNRTTGRFASPDGEFGMLYLGEDEFCSFLEAFSQEVNNERFRGPVASIRRLEQCCLCPVHVSGEVRLADLTNGAALRSLSPDADNRINDGPHAVSQLWSRAFWAHPSRPDGLLYRSRRVPERCAIALFDRVAARVETDCEQNLLARPVRLASLLDHYGCALIP